MPPKKYRVITVHKEVYETLLKIADRDNLSLNDTIRKILEFYVRHYLGGKLWKDYS